MSKKPTTFAISPLDLLLLGTLGIGALLYITRKLRAAPPPAAGDAARPSDKAPSNKPERNFVKLMEQQVHLPTT